MDLYKGVAAGAIALAAASSVVYAEPGDLFAGPEGGSTYFSGIHNGGMASGWTAVTRYGVGGERAVTISANGVVPLQNLGNPSPTTSVMSLVYGMNDAGIAVGTALGPANGEGLDGGYRPMRWNASGAIEELGILGLDADNGTHGVAYDINASGVVVGKVRDHRVISSPFDAPMLPVRWNPGSPEPVIYETLGASSTGYFAAEIHAINDANVSIGYSDRYNDNGDFLGSRAVRWNANGQVEELNALFFEADGSAYTTALAINEAGAVVGTAYREDAGLMQRGDFPVVWQANSTTPTVLQVPASAFAGDRSLDGRPEAINNNGAVIGNYGLYIPHPADPEDRLEMGKRAYLWTSAEAAPIELPVLNVGANGESYAVANGITDNGYIVGAIDVHSQPGEWERMAAVWTPDHQVHLLKDLFPLPDGWHSFVEALAITNDGWITGIGMYQGINDPEPYERSFLMHLDIGVVPEPATAGLVSLLAIPLMRRRRPA